MSVIVISRTLTTLAAAEARTSSQRYELGLASAMSDLTTTRVISLSASIGAESEGLELTALGASPRGLVSAARLLRELLRKRSRGAVVLASGYDPVFVLVLTIARANLCMPYLIIFDSHTGALSKLGKTKARFVDIYFRIGRALLSAVSGLIVVSETAKQRLRVPDRKILMSRVGGSEEDSLAWSPPPSLEFRVLYAGALENYNGIGGMVAAFNTINAGASSERSFVLDIYGDGSMREFVEIADRKTESICYHGQASHAEIRSAIKRCHLALNLRDKNDPIMDYAFPSKLIELWSYGVPTLTTPVLPEPVLARFSLVTERIDERSIVEALQRAEREYDSLVMIAADAPDFVRTNYSWVDIARELAAFTGLSVVGSVAE